MRSSTLASFPGLAAEAMVRAYIEDVFNRISIALGSKLKRRLAVDLAALRISVR
jgi:hypothetical protein